MSCFNTFLIERHACLMLSTASAVSVTASWWNFMKDN